MRLNPASAGFFYACLPDGGCALSGLRSDIIMWLCDHVGPVNGVPPGKTWSTGI
ncbi:hypothetical protein CKO_01305 [Citrobacter koseri ATCC BAA-895]|uniref:Uncharacterized protein n=1 Tax=Citrobacter koseri (strain ATCC BAA-895 / CDC 4225-83 / SGSC4696) TaxID=290338 RepID=A8AG32_CITK8|nr:hypothetical protein CKO_01305 [Citrobacter koseri ATCC BAA-895]